jgi:hypothetical protein
MTVEFVIPGKITSANRVTRSLAYITWVDGKPVAKSRAVKSAEATEDHERIVSLATAAKAKAGWKVPACAALEIYAMNCGYDVGNIEKVIGDGIKGGLLIVDDRPKYLESLFVRHLSDAHGRRYIVRVRAVSEELPL